MQRRVIAQGLAVRRPCAQAVCDCNQHSDEQPSRAVIRMRTSSVPTISNPGSAFPQVEQLGFASHPGMLCM